MLETTVLQGGCYVGRRFSLMGFHLLWLIEPQQVKLIGTDGSVVEAESLEDFFQANRYTGQAHTNEGPTGPKGSGSSESSGDSEATGGSVEML